MIEIDVTIMIVSAVLIVLAIIASLINPFLRGVSESSESSDNVEPVTLLIPSHSQVVELERNLPMFLQQEYAPGYQVIVVCDKGDNESIDFLKRLEGDYPFLYHTFIPESSRYMSRKKLQITVGVKAAKNEWIILTEPTCRPENNQWLNAMAKQCREENQLVLGYVALDEETSGYRRFESIRTAYYLIRRAQRSYGYRTHMPLVAFRKSDFMQENGYQGNLQLERGEYDFLVNKYAQCGHGDTVVALHPATWLIQEEPSNKSWHNAHLYLLASRKYLHRHVSMQILQFFDHLLPHLSILCSLAMIVYGVLTEDWILTGCAGASLLILYILRMIIAHRAVKKFDENLQTMALPFYEYSIVFRNMVRRLRYWHADKTDFTSHKL